MDNFDYVLFKNEIGDSKKLTINKTDIEEIKTIDGNEYKTESISYQLIDPIDNSYSIKISASSQYDSDYSSREYIACFLLRSSLGIHLPLLNIDENGEAQTATKSNFMPNNRLYNDVFRSNEILNRMDNYSVLYYNFEFGVIGFKDKDNKLWTFDKYAN